MSRVSAGKTNAIPTEPSGRLQNVKLEAILTETASVAGILNWRDPYLRVFFLTFSGLKIDPSESQAEVKAVQTTWTPELAQVHVTGPYPPFSPETKIEVQMLQRIIILFFSIIVWRAARERAQI